MSDEAILTKGEQVLTKVNDNVLLGNKPIALNDPVIQKQLEQIMQQNIIQNVYKPPKTDFIIKNPIVSRILGSGNNLNPYLLFMVTDLYGHST